MAAHGEQEEAVVPELVDLVHVCVALSEELHQVSEHDEHDTGGHPQVGDG